MAYIEFTELTTAQRLEAIHLRPAWHLSNFRKFQFWIKPDGHVSHRKGHHQIGAEGDAMIDAMLEGDDVRSKGDNREWKPGVTYHFIRD